ncbi:MAG: FAD-dependent oxidoreductase [Pseudomonadota bacterium]
MNRCDVAIVGAGLTGLAAAIGLAEQGRKVVVVDPRPPTMPEPSAAISLRVSTFSPASRSFLEALGAWRRVPVTRSFGFSRMSVWEDDPARALFFDAGDAGRDTLGHVVENETAQAALWDRAAECCDLVSAAVDTIELEDRSARLTLDDGSRLKTQVLVGADGGRSRVRAAAHIEVKAHDYFQSGVVTVVDTEHPHGGTARQRFLDGYPLALLPLGDRQVSIVWSQPTSTARRLVGVEAEDFTERLQAASQHVLGMLRAPGQRAAFPLRRQSAVRYARGSTVLIGDAAHQVHPLAGQGANIGLLDAAALIECLEGANDPVLALRRYERWRRSDAELMSFGIHCIGAAYRLPGLAGSARRLGTATVNAIPGLTGLFTRHASGLGGRVPRLARPRR